MNRHLIIVFMLTLTGCGAEVASTAAVSAVNRAQEVRSAAPIAEQTRQRLDAAQQAAQLARDNAEKAAGP
jgi:hypothetical protein